MKVKDEIERLDRELGKLDEPWVFVARRGYRKPRAIRHPERVPDHLSP